MSILAKMLVIKIAHSDVSVISARLMHDLTIATKNLVGKLRESFIIGLVWVVTQEGSVPCSAV